MATIRKYWRAVALVLTIAAGIAMHQFSPTPVQGAPPPSEVIVTNTPLPISGTVGVSGTPDVNIANTPSVNAAQSGAWNVGITGGSIRDADNPAFQPVQVSGTCNIGDGFGGCNTGPLYTVQAGKRLVVEFVSAVATLNPTENLEAFDIVTKAGGTTTNHFLSPSHHFDDGSTSFWSASLAMRLYADPSSTVTLQCSRHDTTGTAVCFFTFSGYLVNVS